MKKVILMFLVLFSLTGLAAEVKLGIINPTPHNLEKTLYLIQNDLITPNNMEIVGIYHHSQLQSIRDTEEFITKNGYDHVSISIVKNDLSSDSLFMVNSCTEEFRELFSRTDGLIFLGGTDIAPKLYGEETFLTTELIPAERNWEISFLFHLLGGSQNTSFSPFLENKQEYPILGICLGMQQMNVATGGTLYQDIPFQLYKKESYESVLAQSPEEQHKNYQEKINKRNEKKQNLHFHHVKITPNSLLDFGYIRSPLILSVHHQSIKEPGMSFKVIATSMDNQVVEAMSHTKYRNVYGIQFHTEYPLLYEQQELPDARNEFVLFTDDDILFHHQFWKDFSNRLQHKNR